MDLYLRLIKEKNVIQKEIRFLIKSSTEEKWWMSFKDSLKKYFLQSAIIPAFRDTKDQLRNFKLFLVLKIIKKLYKIWWWKLIKSFSKCKNTMTDNF